MRAWVHAAVAAYCGCPLAAPAPAVHRDPVSRRYLLFYEATHRAEPPLDCVAQPAAPPLDVSKTRRIGVASAVSLLGPWERLDQPILAPRAAGAWDAGDVSNAAPHLLTNGTTLLGYRANGDGVALGGGIGVAVAATWRGPYTRTGPTARHMLFAAEDGALYADRRGHLHMLVHRFASANGSTAGSAVGGHAWSADGITWAYAEDSTAYTTAVRWENGTSTQLYRRERPKPALDSEGRLIALFNGAWPCHSGGEDDDSLDGPIGCYSFTMQTAMASKDKEDSMHTVIVNAHSDRVH